MIVTVLWEQNESPERRKSSRADEKAAAMATRIGLAGAQRRKRKSDVRGKET